MERLPADDNAFNEVNDGGTDKLDHTDDTYEMEELSASEPFGSLLARGSNKGYLLKGRV